jgi:phosphoglycerate dehydrogenase-like enzyme
MRRGEWKRAEFQGFELRGKLLGVIGFGRIGREVARLAQAFGMRVVASDPFLEESHAAGVHLHTLDDVLSRADFVSIHVPLDSENQGLLSREHLARMKRGSYLLNLSRGGLVDEAAVMDLLDSGHPPAARRHGCGGAPGGAMDGRIRAAAAAAHRRIHAGARSASAWNSWTMEAAALHE